MNRLKKGRRSALKTAAVSVLGVAVYSLFSEESYLHEDGRRFLTSELEHEMDMMYSSQVEQSSASSEVSVADDADADAAESDDMSYLTSSHSTLLPWAQNNLVDIHDGPKKVDATNMFWHIP